MTEIHIDPPSPPEELITTLGAAYRDYRIETRELITMAFQAGYALGYLAQAPQEEPCT